MFCVFVTLCMYIKPIKQNKNPKNDKKTITLWVNPQTSCLPHCVFPHSNLVSCVSFHPVCKRVKTKQTKNDKNKKTETIKSFYSNWFVRDYTEASDFDEASMPVVAIGQCAASSPRVTTNGFTSVLISRQQLNLSKKKFLRFELIRPRPKRPPITTRNRFQLPRSLRCQLFSTPTIATNGLTWVPINSAADQRFRWRFWRSPRDKGCCREDQNPYYPFHKVACLRPGSI